MQTLFKSIFRRLNIKCFNLKKIFIVIVLTLIGYYSLTFTNFHRAKNISILTLFKTDTIESIIQKDEPIISQKINEELKPSACKIYTDHKDLKNKKKHDYYDDGCMSVR